LINTEEAGAVKIYLGEASHQWLMLIILATWEAEIRRIIFEANLGK
jgi:hypothetical protein